MCTRFIVLIIGFVRCCLLQWLCRLSKAGAHYNPSMSFSNFFIKFSPNKFNPFFMWTYFKAEFVPAFLAYNMAFYLNGYYSPIDLPKTRQEAISIVLSELMGTFMLVFLLQLNGNSQTTFATSDMQMYGFVVVFVYVARKFAVCSGNNINPVANLACVIAAVFQCNFRAVLAFTLYLLGDFLGSCLGVIFFNIVYQPALAISRKQRLKNQKQDKIDNNQNDHQHCQLQSLIKQFSETNNKVSEQQQEKYIVPSIKISNPSPPQIAKNQPIFKLKSFQNDFSPIHPSYSLKQHQNQLPQENKHIQQHQAQQIDINKLTNIQPKQPQTENPLNQDQDDLEDLKLLDPIFQKLIGIQSLDLDHLSNNRRSSLINGNENQGNQMKNNGKDKN